MPKIRKTIDVTEVNQAIEALAQKETRDFSTMCLILLKEALHYREQKAGVVSLPEIFRSLPFTESRGLFEIIKKSLNILANQFLNKSPASKFIQGWDITQLSAVSGISPERLAEIVQGSQINADEAVGLMHAGMNPLELAPNTLKKEGEPNGTGKHE